MTRVLIAILAAAVVALTIALAPPSPAERNQPEGLLGPGFQP